MKTKTQWDESHQDFTTFVQVGEQVDEEIVDYFIECLPPATMNSKCVQCGEPTRHIGNKPAYITFEKPPSAFILSNSEWIYTGIKVKQ